MTNKKPLISFKKLNMKLFIYFIVPIVIVLIVTSLVCANTMSKNVKQSYERQVKAEAKTISESRKSFYKNHITKFSKVDFVNIQALMKYSQSNKDISKNPYYSIVKNSLNDTYSLEDNNILGIWAADFSANTGFSNSTYEWSATGKEWDITSCIWYKEAFTTKETYVTEPYESGMTGKTIISIVQPIMDKNYEDVLGVVGMDLAADNVFDTIKSNINNESSYAIVVSDNKCICYCIEEKNLYKNINDISAYQEISTKLNQGFEGNCIITVDNEEVIAYFNKEADLKCTTISILPMTVIDEEIQKFSDSVLLIFLISIIVLVIVLIFVSNTIVRPIKKITKEAEKISNGTYTGSIDEISHDEVGQLIKTFNKTIISLRYRAEYDSLTKIYNADTLYLKTNELIMSSLETKYTVLRMDIANFKIVNDLYGWDEGNSILEYIGRVLKEAIPENALCGRIGGDVFGIVTEYKNGKQVIELTKEISERIGEYQSGYCPKVYFGICPILDINIPVNVLFDWAKMALKTIKGSVLVNYSFYDNKIREKMLNDKEIEGEMEQAIKNEEFTIYLQPKCDILSSEIVGAEALVRWIHPKKGIIQPDKFIPLFEKNGFIIPLDEYVWEKACIAIQRWKSVGYDIIPISINISRLHIHDVEFFNKIISLVNQYDIPHNMLELEFTESAFLENEDSMYQVMIKLREAGFTVSMDDFGSGYSSLNMLKNGPLDIIKIDREFLNETVATENGKTVIKGAISIVKELDLDIIAEGVENEEQAQFLLDAGCNTAQGYFYSKPVDIETFERLAFKGKKVK